MRPAEHLRYEVMHRLPFYRARITKGKEKTPLTTHYLLYGRRGSGCLVLAGQNARVVVDGDPKVVLVVVVRMVIEVRAEIMVEERKKVYDRKKNKKEDGTGTLKLLTT